MSKVLVYTSPARGHLYPVMDLALQLRARGHDVRVRTLASELAAVERAGLQAKPIAAAIEARPVDDWQAKTPMESVKRSLRAFVDRAALEVGDLRAATAEEQPDLLLLDTNTWGAQAAAETSGLPWATWHPFPLPLASKDVPPFGLGLPLARGPLGRLRDALLRPLLTAPLQAMLPDLNRVRASVGARPFTHISDLYRAPPVLLHRTAEPFEYPRRDWPPNIHLVGPGLWSPPSEAPAWLAGRQKPIVLVTCSTEYQNDGPLVQAAIDAFGKDGDVQLVCTTAGVDPTLFAPPPGVVLERFVPHAHVLPRASAVVCHGGMGITQRALSAGVPVCVVPWGRDQVDVGRRVVEAKAGTMLRRGRLRADRLRAAVQQARALASGAAAISQAYARAGGAPRAADLLEGLLRNGSGQPRPAASAA